MSVRRPDQGQGRVWHCPGAGACVVADTAQSAPAKDLQSWWPYALASAPDLPEVKLPKFTMLPPWRSRQRAL